MTSTPASPVLVIGGGLAGASAAILLARGGMPVTLVEREATQRHKVCGEFLSAEALGILDALGISPSLLGAETVHMVRLCEARRTITAPLPFAAQSLSRQCLDAALLSCAEAAGVVVRRGAQVESLTRDADVFRATLNDGSAVRASSVVLATGKHDLRGLPRSPGQQNDLVALKMYWQLAPAQAEALRGAVELLLHPHGYTGLQLVEGNRANLCGLVRRRHLGKLGGWANLLSELLATNQHARSRLAGAEPLLPKPLAIAAIPYGFVRRAAVGSGLYAVGDQAAVIPSFTGDGMSIALYSGVRAAQALLAGQSAQAFQAELHRDLYRQVARATLLSRALVSAAGKTVILKAATLWPGGLGLAAHATRVPARAMARIS